MDDEFLAVYHDFGYFLSVDGYLSVLVDFGSGQSLDEFLYGRALWCAVGRCVIYKGVGAQRHLGGLSGDGGSAQHDGVGLHLHGAQAEVLVGGEGDIAGEILVSHAGELQDEAPGGGAEGELAVKAGQYALNECAVLSQQSYGGLGDRLAALVFHYCSCHVALAHGERRHGGQQD